MSERGDMRVVDSATMDQVVLSMQHLSDTTVLLGLVEDAQAEGDTRVALALVDLAVDKWAHALGHLRQALKGDPDDQIEVMVREIRASIDLARQELHRFKPEPKAEEQGK